METQLDSRPDQTGRSVYLFVTCLADLFRPSVAFDSIRLLEDAGCRVSVPVAQTCCGQPAYNSGDYDSTAALAQQVIALLEPAEYVVVPSGSCAGMICEHYPTLLQGEWRDRALELGSRTFEITSFLGDVLKVKPPVRAHDGAPVVTYHDSCAGLRELGIKTQPRQLLRQYCGVEVKELQQTDVCCGFGGTFCVKYPDISTRLVEDKTRRIKSSGADTLLGGDLGCLLNIAGKLKREGSPVKVYHAAEVLAGFTGQTAPLGEK